MSQVMYQNWANSSIPHDGNHHGASGETGSHFDDRTPSGVRRSSDMETAVIPTPPPPSCASPMVLDPLQHPAERQISAEEKIRNGAEYSSTSTPRHQSENQPPSSIKKVRSQMSKHPMQAHKPWILNFTKHKPDLSKYRPSKTLKNSGSVARDHLASERTFLAYVRTSIALAGMGVALVQLFTIVDVTSRSLGLDKNGSGKDSLWDRGATKRFAKPLGSATVVFGLVVLFIGVYRYFLIQVSLPEQKFPVARYSVALIAFILGALVVVIFAALMAG